MGKTDDKLALSLLHLDIEADVNHRVRERPDSTPFFIFFSVLTVGELTFF